MGKKLCFQSSWKVFFLRSTIWLLNLWRTASLLSHRPSQTILEVVSGEASQMTTIFECEITKKLTQNVKFKVWWFYCKVFVVVTWESRSGNKKTSRLKRCSWSSKLTENFQSKKITSKLLGFGCCSSSLFFSQGIIGSQHT